MIFKNGNNIFKNNANIFQNGVSWNFVVQGSQFPAQPFSSSANFLNINFSAASSVIIDFGNGDVLTYATKGSGTNSIFSFYNTGTGGSLPVTAYEHYTYPDGLNLLRTVRITVLNRNLVTGFMYSEPTSTYGIVSQVLPVRFGDIPNLNNIALTSTNLSGIDESYLLSNSITTLAFRTAFATGTRYYRTIPIDVIQGKSYTSFTWGDTMTNIAFSVTNLDKIATYLASSLITLTTTMSLADNNGGQGALPSNFNLLTSLTNFNCLGNLWTAIPAVINTMTSLQVLSLAQNLNLASWGDLSALTNLIQLNISPNLHLPLTLPAYFATLTTLKILDTQGIGIVGGQTTTDTFVSNFYNYTVANATITGPTSGTGSNMRGWIVRADNNVPGDSTPTPLGIYQQPSGYIHGSNNGTPASPLEMIWVLKHQYGHMWYWAGGSSI